eukprot:CAMPEP_0195517234 /NCGR_PEP_ID=MMETSP0794_2-20130614/10254_1 /TAXON_ID=515487 /ORGANISM="Stephanopyxis turris, Strain CCMP 815" /LENGTH=86 /DNA_ID=CAMNT_0040646007 /DNA_START=53 /DNA_END=314 /DNA_ORIENTATION=+
MIYAVQSAMYASFLVVAPSSGSSKGGASSGGHKKAEVKAKGSDGSIKGNDLGPLGEMPSSTWTQHNTPRSLDVADPLISRACFVRI